MRLKILLLPVLAACSSATETIEPPLPKPPEPIPASLTLALQQVASGLSGPVYVTAPAGDARLFIVEQPGRIRIVENGVLLATPFLDITPRVAAGGERGMLSVAFHPQYKTNGYFYVYFIGMSGEIRVERFTAVPAANVANAGTAKIILTVPHPLTNHNGGLAMFGPDGMLYLGLGDGGGGGDPGRNGQNANTLLGAMLRIDVNNGDPFAIPAGNPYIGRSDARPEIWALGLRNPWRFTFDRATNDLYIADVGQDALEEVDVVPASRAGVNYGWNVMEGSQCYNAGSCNKQGLELPVLEYNHSGGQCSITGGFVYRGAAIPELTASYFYADYCAGWVRSFRYSNGAATEQRQWAVGSVGFITSFGEDAAGEPYVTSSNGRVYRIVKGS